MNFIDAHCHLHLPWFTDSKFEKIIADAHGNGVNTIISCASDPKNFDEVISSTKYSEIYITLGLQPTLADNFLNADPLRDIFEDANKTKKFVAIGEVGLDYHWIKEDKLRKKQAELFVDCINLANNNQIPLVIHSRKAETKCLDILEKHSQVPVLLHSFEGNLNDINRSNDLGYLISIPTNVVIRKSRRKVVKRAGLDNIVLETDSPYCGPEEDSFPNTPMNIIRGAQRIARELEINLEEISNATTRNAKRFYQI